MECYEFKNESYYERPFCDCCESTYMESYTCISHNFNGSQGSEDDCYIEVLRDAGLVLEDDESVYNLSSNQLKRLCVMNDIMVVFYD